MARALQIFHPDPEENRVALYDLMGKSFGDYWGSLEYCRNGYIEESNYDWETSLIGLIDDEIVSHFGVWEFRLRVGIDSVRTGGIGAVMTDRRYRKRGYMKETAEAGTSSLSAAGYGLSLLFGIPDFYDRFGYVSAWKYSTVTVASDDLPDPATKVRLRKADIGGDSQLDTIANRTNSGLTGTAIRPTYRRNRRPDEWLCFRWQTGTAGGYVVVEQHDQRCSLIDCGGKPEDILSACTQLIKRFNCTELSIPELHQRHALFNVLRDVRYRREEFNSPTGGAMITITNLQVALESIRKTLMRRLRESSFSGWTGSLTIQRDRDLVVLRFDRRGLAIIPGSSRDRGIREKTHRVRAGEELVQLLVGTDDPYRIIDRHKIRTFGDAKGLICALFPEQFPCLGTWDQM